MTFDEELFLETGFRRQTTECGTFLTNLCGTKKRHLVHCIPEKHSSGIIHNTAYLISFFLSWNYLIPVDYQNW